MFPTVLTRVIKPKWMSGETMSLPETINTQRLAQRTNRINAWMRFHAIVAWKTCARIDCILTMHHHSLFVHSSIFNSSVKLYVLTRTCLISGENNLEKKRYIYQGPSIKDVRSKVNQCGRPRTGKGSAIDRTSTNGKFFCVLESLLEFDTSPDHEVPDRKLLCV